MRLLLVLVHEPIPGLVLPSLTAELGAEKACDYYKAMIEVMLRQLRGLEKCRIRFCYTPADAGDALKFWLLPKMEAISSNEANLYHVPPNTPGEPAQEVDFRPIGNKITTEGLGKAFAEGFEVGFDQIGALDPTCLECGARWINAAFSRLHPETNRDVIIGPNHEGHYYFLAMKSNTPELFADLSWDSPSLLSETHTAAVQAKREVELLPPLMNTSKAQDWQAMMESPLGAALRKAIGEPLDDMTL